MQHILDHDGELTEAARAELTGDITMQWSAWQGDVKFDLVMAFLQEAYNRGDLFQHFSREYTQHEYLICNAMRERCGK